MERVGRAPPPANLRFQSELRPSFISVTSEHVPISLFPKGTTAEFRFRGQGRREPHLSPHKIRTAEFVRKTEKGLRTCSVCWTIGGVKCARLWALT